MVSTTAEGWLLRLFGDRALVELAPEMGGAVARYDVETPAGWQPILLASTDSGRTGPLALASNVLAPWSNRISGGGFSFEGQFHALESNGERYPNHGNAYSSVWNVAEADESHAVLAFSSEGPGPSATMRG
jgi:aldose 1-epimerase